MQGPRNVRGRRAKISLIVLPALTAAALVAAPAASAGKLKIASTTLTINGLGVNGSARATCPKGTRAFAGGYATSKPAISSFPSAQNLLIVNESRRSGARAWRVSAGQLGTGSGKLRAFAYCRVGKLTEVVTPTPLPAAGRSEAGATARCPSGMNVISGGFAVPEVVSLKQFAFVTDDLLDGPTEWTVHGVRSSDLAPAEGSVTAYAYCGRGAPLKTKSLTTAATTGPIEISARSPSCKQGSATLSGGFLAPYAQSGTARETTFVTESRLAGRGWLASGEAFGSTGLTLKLSAFAYCR